jgi:fatty-acyl-CoA synthase
LDDHFIVRNLADIEAIERVPLSERIKASSTYELLQQGAAIDPEAVAIHFIRDGERFDRPLSVTYREFTKKINQTANLLHDLGVGPTDVVTYLLPNLPQTHFVLWGAEAAGIANPVNPLLEADTIRDICRAAGTRVLVALGEVPGSAIWPKVAAIRKEIPTLEHIIRVQGPSAETDGIIGYEEKVETYPGDRLLSSRTIDPEDIASLYHTGGTTGRPKLARRSHLNEVALVWDLRVGMDLRPGEPVMCGLPLFHCNGTCITGLLPFTVGGSVVLLSAAGYRDPAIMKNFYKIVERYRPVFFSAVPTVLSVLLDIPVAGADIASLRYLVCGAAPLSVELFRRFEAHSGMKILEGYGLTESTCASAVNPRDGERKIGSIGLRLPYQQMKISVLDEAGKFQREARPNEIGAVCLRGPCVFKGYVEDIHNQGIWLEGGWFNTGDLGRQDEDGYFWLTGRKKELIIRGGHNIDPAAIEEPLYKMPRVKMAAAVGRPDPHAGEVPVVYVEPVEGSSLTGAEVLDWAREHIGERAAVPKEVFIIERLPLTAVGKIFKPALRWDAIRRVYEAELASLADLREKGTVTVGEDPVSGTRAVFRVELRPGTDPEAFRRRLAEQLKRYSIPYELVIG